MTSILTAAGVANLQERAQGQAVTNMFGGLVLGAGNDAPTAQDTLASVTARESLPVLRVSRDYPQVNDPDPRNPFAAPNVTTWRFEREAGTPFVASNLAITNFAGGAMRPNEPLLMHARLPASELETQQLAQRFDERIVIFVNAAIGRAPLIVIRREHALQNRVQRVESFTARTRAIQNHPAGSVIDDTTTRVRPQPGQQVFTAARLFGPSGRSLLVSDVDSFKVTTETQEAETGLWVPIKLERPDCATNVLETLERHDQRWRADGGYNVFHIWKQPRGTTEGTFRLRYELRLCDGDLRAWTTIVEVR